MKGLAWYNGGEELVYLRGVKTYIDHHKHIVLLLIADSELALCLFVVLREVLEILDRLALQHRGGELDVCFGVFVAGLESYWASSAGLFLAQCMTQIHLQVSRGGEAYVDLCVIWQ
jgi:hypothetical protein